MHNNNDYPVGADNIHAPWNEPEETYNNVEVGVTLEYYNELTLSIDGDIDEDRQDILCDEVEAQFTLPHRLISLLQDAAKDPDYTIADFIKKHKAEFECLSRWELTDIHVEEL